MSQVMHYVCDRCGHYFSREPASMMECPVADCQSASLWEFNRKDAALQHSRHIQLGLSSGLFRSAS